MTNQENSGPTELPKQTLKELVEELQKFKDLVGIDRIRKDGEAIKILESDFAYRSKFTEEECGDGAFALRQYAAYLQVEDNKNKAKYNWAEAHLKKLYGEFGLKYGDKYTKYEERMSMLIANNPSAEALHKIMTAVKTRMDTLFFLATDVRALAGNLEERQKTLRGRRYERNRTN